MFFPYKDDNPRILVPYLTYGIIGLNILIFLFQVGLGQTNQNLILHFGLIPAHWSLISLFTSMFLHGGFAHLLGNMWFLWLFGDNVESALGHVRYLIFYFLCGVGAAVAQTAINLDSLIPMIGRVCFFHHSDGVVNQFFHGFPIFWLLIFFLSG